MPLFFCFQRKNKISHDIIRQRKRRLRYQILYDALSNNIFELILPVSQGLDPKFPSGALGYCKGYADTWIEQFVETDKLKLPSVSEDEWENLKGETAYELTGIPLTEEIKIKHQKQNEYNVRFWQGSDFSDLIDIILDHVSDLGKKEIENHHYIYRIVLSNSYKKPNYCFRTCLGSSLRCSKGHIILFVQDPDRYVHIFDANLGWFRSRQSKPMLSDCIQGLTRILNTMNLRECKESIAIVEPEERISCKNSF